MSEPKHVLVVDDEKGFVAFLKSLLLTKGYRVSTAFNGREGLKRLEEGDPDLLILDIGMPKMGGIELYTRICSPNGRTRYPVLVLTAIEELTDFFHRTLVDAFLSKPFQVNALLDEIQRLVTDGAVPPLWLAAPQGAATDAIQNALGAERFTVRRISSPEDLRSPGGKTPQFVLIEDTWSDGLRDEVIEAARGLSGGARVPVVVYGGSEVPAEPKAIFQAMMRAQEQRFERL